jgi:hypothetical protein
VASVVEHIDFATPATLPEGVDERRRWLSGLGDIYFALGAARRLAVDPTAGWAWASSLAEALAVVAAGRLALVGHARGMWLFGRLAENSLRECPRHEPWQTVLASAQIGEFDGGDQTEVVRYWALGDLSTKNAEFVREAVAKYPAWRDAYRGYLQRRLNEVRFLDIDPRLLIHPVLKAPLPHLGESLEIWRSAEGFLIRWGDAQPRTIVADSDAMLRIVGDPTTGPFSARVKVLEPHLLQTAFQAVTAVAELAHANDTSDATALSLAKGIADAFGSEDKPTSWFEHLRSAAAAFDGGTEPLEDDELATTYALEARASLELLCYRMGKDDQMFAVLAAIDESLRGISGAVMLLDHDEYFEALGSIEPQAGTWWGERIYVDERVREEALDSALEQWGTNERAPVGGSAVVPIRAEVPEHPSFLADLLHLLDVTLAQAADVFTQWHALAPRFAHGMARGAGAVVIRGTFGANQLRASISPMDRISADTIFNLIVRDPPAGLKGRAVRLLIEGSTLPPARLAEGRFITDKIAQMGIPSPAVLGQPAEIPPGAVVQLSAQLRFEVEG